MFRVILGFLLFASSIAEDIVLQPSSSADLLAPTASLIFIQGADISNDAYVPLCKAIQDLSNLRLWVRFSATTINLLKI